MPGPRVPSWSLERLVIFTQSPMENTADHASAVYYITGQLVIVLVDAIAAVQ